MWPKPLTHLITILLIVLLFSMYREDTNPNFEEVNPESIPAWPRNAEIINNGIRCGRSL